MFRISTLLLILGMSPALAFGQENINDASEKAIKSAVKVASPFVATIETSGGQDVIRPGGGPGGRPSPGIRKGVGPTTGLIVDQAGFVITSSFNFANNPTDIYVSVPGQQRRRAKVVGKDTSRMLTLLELIPGVDEKGPIKLQVPAAFPKKDILVGQWSLALGRALEPDINQPASVSVGIISATGRIWGKAIQTDCKVSPINYGGPLVAVDGRVMGVLVPASPQGEGETVGVEWYDSGIGFAIPLEDIYAVLAKMKALKDGESLRRGLIGFNPKDPGEMYNVPVTIGNIAPESVAQKIGLEVGDEIIRIDNEEVSNYSELMHILGPKYEGDVIDLVVLRDGKEVAFKKIALGGSEVSFAQPFLGILPMRDDPDPGVEIRFVYPNSPALEAGLKAGDRIMKIAPANRPQLAPITGGRNQLTSMLGQIPAGTEAKFEIKRAGKEAKTETITLKLATLTEELPARSALPYPSTKERALERPKGPNPKGPNPKGPKPKDDPKPMEPKEEDKFETGYIEGANSTTGREYWMYLPTDYNKNRSYGVIIWFHGAGQGKNDGKDMEKIWADFCDQANFIMIGPKSKKAEGWVASEAEEVVQMINAAIQPFTIDRTRIVTHGMGLGGQMALYLSFNARELIRGVAASGAVLASNPKDNLPNQPLSFFLVAGDKDPLLKEIKDTRDKLKEKKFPMIYREIKDFGKEYLDQTTLDELVVWLESLDRI